MPSQVKNGTRNSIATIGTLSGADEIFQSWYQSWTLIAQITAISKSTPQIVHLLMNLFINYVFFLVTAFISDSSMTGAGPEIPPSFRMRQKWTAIKIDATSGMPMQCQM